MSTFSNLSATVIYLLIILANAYANGIDLYEGSSCKMKDDRAGVCTKLPECESILEALKKRVFPFKNLVICSFIGSTEVICCPDKTVSLMVSPNPPIDTTGIIFDQNYLNRANFPSSTTTTTTTTTTSSPPLSVERVVTVDNIHITDNAEYIDLTKLLKRPPQSSTERTAKIVEQSYDPDVIFTRRSSTTTRRPNAWIRDSKFVDETTRWQSSTTTTPRSTFLLPVRDRSPNPRANDLKPWNGHEEYFAPPTRSPFWDGFDWPNNSRTTARRTQRTTTTTKRSFRPKPNPRPDEVDFGVILPDNQQENSIEPSDPWQQGGSRLPTTLKTTTTTKQPRIVDTSDIDAWQPWAFPSTPTTTTTTNRAISNPFVTITSSPRPFANTNNPNTGLDPWMVNVLLAASTTTSTTTSRSIANPSNIFSGNSPDVYNEISPSTNTRDPITPAPTPPTSRSGGRKADIACVNYTRTFTKPIDFHILDGQPTYLGEFPHMAALGYPSIAEGESILWDCGGSLISDRYVLTAAHCVNRVGRQPTVIRLGTINLEASTEDSIDVGVELITLHPLYLSSRQYHDVALIRLNATIEFSTVVRPACLNTDLEDVASNIPVVATGWGSVSLATRAKSPVLLKVNLTSVELNSCNQSYVEYGLQRRFPDGLNQGQLCAFDPGLKKDACEGDSGGPLQIVTEEGVSTIVGIVSFGIACASSIPGVYARISFYLDWVEPIVWT